MRVIFSLSVGYAQSFAVDFEICLINPVDCSTTLGRMEQKRRGQSINISTRKNKPVWAGVTRPANYSSYIVSYIVSTFSFLLIPFLLCVESALNIVVTVCCCTFSRPTTNDAWYGRIENRVLPRVGSTKYPKGKS